MIAWSSLRGVGESKLLRSSGVWLVVVPMLARAASKLEETIRIDLFGTAVQVDVALPFTWQIFFFASVAFAIAGGLYSIRCPRLLRETPNFQDFRQQGKGMSFLESHLEAQEEGERLTEAQRAVAAARAAGPDHSTRLLGTAFHAAHEHSDHLRPKSRRSCLAFYCLAFFLLAMVFVENFWYVVSASM